jgi:uncharacterized protein YecE (DUF72 family)
LPPASKKPSGAFPQETSNKQTVAPALGAPARNLFAGTSGWAYPAWKPRFYPADVPARAFLGYYAVQLNSVEVNYTFRKLPSTSQLQGWLDATAGGFRFSFKAPQRITHFQRLRESDITVAEFIAALEPARASGKLGPLLFQLPPNFAADNARLSSFLEIPALADLQITFEFRHASWFSDATYSILRRHNAALCIAESDDLGTPDVATTNFRCYRLRRSGGYSAKQIADLAKRFAALAKKSEIFVYFKHEDEPAGALNAVALLRAAKTGLRK